MDRLRWCIVVLLAWMSLSCTSSRAQRRPYLIMENVDNAARHLEKKETEEAAQIYQAVLIADPFNEKAKSGLASIGKYDASVMKPSLLGTNLRRRPQRESMALWFVMYPVNRVLDLLDVVSISVGLQGGLYLDAHATRAMQADFGAGGGMEIGWWQKRELAAGAAHVAGLALGPFETQGEGYTRVGTHGAKSTSFSMVGMSRPSDYEHQRFRDYWGIGARAIALIVGVEVEFHPVELADALSGVFFVDFLRDDIGRTRRLHLTAADIEAMEDLMGTLSHDELRARMRGRAIPPTELMQKRDEAAPGSKP